MLKPSAYLISLLAITALSACTPPTQKSTWQAQRALTDFQADGRLAVKINDKGSYANFDWQYQNGIQTIDINTPLGNTLGQLCQDPQGVIAINDKGEQFTANSPNELSDQLLGFALPLQHLSTWAHGQWVNGAAHHITPDGSLQQFEWTISRTIHPDGTPRVLEMNSTKLSLRLVFDNLQTINDAMPSFTQCAARKNPS